MTYTQIASVTVSSAVSTVTITSLDQGYRDLVFVINGISNSWSNINGQFNGDSSQNYSQMRLQGYLNTANAYPVSNIDVMRVGWNIGPTIWEVFDYSQTGKYRTTLGQSGHPNEDVTSLNASTWKNTSNAVTSVKFDCAGNNWESGTTIMCYGIEA
tara:strand:+ start:811 stop:1278 length:468 start_codon:yes stop_codon:yes gene_type:complete